MSFSNPSAPDGAVAPQSTRSSLRQDDFRKLLMTPRATSSQTPFPPTPSTPRQPKPEKTRGYKPKKPTTSTSEQDGIQYRDRAKERREGLLGEYAETEQILSTIANAAEPIIPDSLATPAVGPDVQPASVDSFQKLSVDQSKYLGGDVEHTHLVKGLDYTLLDKVRNDLVRTDPANTLKESQSQVQSVVIQSDFARRVYALATKQKKKEKNDIFLPGRMAYQFNLDPSQSFDLPVSIIRSKADVADAANKHAVSNNDVVVDKIIQIIAYVRQGTRPVAAIKKPKKKEVEKSFVQPQAKIVKPPPAVDLNEDIFPEAGRYQPELTTQADEDAPTKENWAKVDSGSWFRSREEPGDSTESAIMSAAVSGRIAMDGVVAVVDVANANSTSATPSTTDQLNSIVQGVLLSAPSLSTSVANDATAGLGMRSMEALRRKIGKDEGEGEVDDYGTTAYYSDDDDADFSKMDQGSNKKGTLSRFDFDDEDEFNRYKESQEALPKAAFQFGVKMGDGRKKGKMLNNNQKLDRDYQQITTMLRDKYNRPDLIPKEKGEYRKPPQTPKQAEQIVTSKRRRVEN